VRVFARSWARARSFVCAAPAGVAAANIDGSTLHSLLKLTLRDKQKTATLSLVRFFSGVVLVNFEELSMISADVLAATEQRVRQVVNAGVVFGGLSIVLGGDLQNLPSVVSTPLWTAGRPPAAEDERDSARYVRRLRGLQVWRCFQTVLFLQRNMRQGADPAFAALCDRMRAGLMTRADVDTINKKCLVSPAAPLVLPETGADSFCPMIVATNALRVQVTKPGS